MRRKKQITQTQAEECQQQRQRQQSRVDRRRRIRNCCIVLADVLAIHLSREPLVVERAPVGGGGSGSEVQAREAYYTACVQLTLGPGQQ